MGRHQFGPAVAAAGLGADRTTIALWTAIADVDLVVPLSGDFLDHRLGLDNRFGNRLGPGTTEDADHCNTHYCQKNTLLHHPSF
jgi:hypothetical protein